MSIMTNPSLSPVTITPANAPVVGLALIKLNCNVAGYILGMAIKAHPGKRKKQRQELVFRLVATNEAFKKMQRTPFTQRIEERIYGELLTALTDEVKRIPEKQRKKLAPP